MNNGKVSAFLLSVILCALLVSACGKPEAPAETHPTPEATQPISSTESDSSKSEQEQDETAAAPVIPEMQPVTDEQTAPGVEIQPTEGGSSTEFTEEDTSGGSAEGNTSSAPSEENGSDGVTDGNISAGFEGEVAPVEPNPIPQPGETTDPDANPNQPETAPANPVVTPTEPIAPGETITDPVEPEIAPVEPETTPAEPEVTQTPTETTGDFEEPTQSPDLEDYELPLVPAF